MMACCETAPMSVMITEARSRQNAWTAALKSKAGSSRCAATFGSVVVSWFRSGGRHMSKSMPGQGHEGPGQMRGSVHCVSSRRWLTTQLQRTALLDSTGPAGEGTAWLGGRFTQPVTRAKVVRRKEGAGQAR